MVRMKIEKLKNGNIIFKLKVPEECEKNILFRRAIMESKKIKKSVRYNYEVPLRFFMPIITNYDKDKIVIDKFSIESYLEFSDSFDERYYVSAEPTPSFMKKWREEGCPDIYKIIINKENNSVEKKVAFKKPVMQIKR